MLSSVRVSNAEDVLNARLFCWIDDKIAAGHDLFTRKWESAGCTANTVAAFIKTQWPSAVAVFACVNWTAVFFNDALIVAETQGGYTTITVTHPSTGARVVATLKESFPERDKRSFLKWFYMSQGQLASEDMPLTGADPHPSFYPWLDDLNGFYEQYAKSSANVLLLVGAPGTGKTTFIRGLLRHTKMQSWVSYDDKVQQEESLYAKFMSIRNKEWSDEEDRYVYTEPNDRMLILEDSDALLSSRTDGNVAMARILNISDGLVAVPARKIVFSTNLGSLNSVDPAILRPGRCFAVVKFRSLSAQEAAKAHSAAHAGRAKDFHSDKKYTLAEALNVSRQDSDEVVKKIGFS